MKFILERIVESFKKHIKDIHRTEIPSKNVEKLLKKLEKWQKLSKNHLS